MTFSRDIFNPRYESRWAVCAVWDGTPIFKQIHKQAQTKQCFTTYSICHFEGET